MVTEGLKGHSKIQEIQSYLTRGRVSEYSHSRQQAGRPAARLPPEMTSITTQNS